MTVALSDGKQRHLSQIHAWAVAYNELMQRGERKSRSLSVYSQGQQAHPPSPSEQILKETSLPANLIHKHSRAGTNKENTSFYYINLALDMQHSLITS